MKTCYVKFTVVRKGPLGPRHVSSVWIPIGRYCVNCGFKPFPYLSKLKGVKNNKEAQIKVGMGRHWGIPIDVICAVKFDEEEDK